MRKKIQPPEPEITKPKFFEYKDGDITYSVKGRACIECDKWQEDLTVKYVKSLIIDHYYIDQKKVEESKVPLWIQEKLKDPMYKIDSWNTQEKKDETIKTKTG